MKGGMFGRSAWAVLLAVTTLTATGGGGQERAGLRLRFPDVDLTGLSIKYLLTGPFGGYGSFVQTTPDQRDYLVDTSREGQRAGAIKAIVYCPGYRTVLISQHLDAARPHDVLNVGLEPIGWIPLTGLVNGIAQPQRFSLEVQYLARWSHEFFGILDGPITSFTIASTALRPHGSFVTRVPDLARDPVIANRPDDERGALRLTPREVGTGNVPYTLELVTGVGTTHEIPVAESYAEDLMLVAVVR